MDARALFAVSVLSLAAPALAAGQGTGARVSVQGAAGTHLNAGGHSLSVSLGFSPHERLDLLISGERIHVPAEMTRFGATRGGTSTFISGEVRFAPVTFDRVSPYVLASMGRGQSRPTVNDLFPNRVTNDAWLLFVGGGVRVPLTAHLGAFADMRSGIQGELDTIFLLLPVRAGIAWRF